MIYVYAVVAAILITGLLILGMVWGIVGVLITYMPVLFLGWCVAGCPTWAERPGGPNSRS